MRWKLAAVYNPHQFSNGLREFVEHNRIDFIAYGQADIKYIRALAELRGFHVIRDPRDMAVSAYFSHLYSHPTADWPELIKHRKILQSLSKREGLLLEILECHQAEFKRMEVTMRLPCS
jgi:hypothetical protein